MTSKKTKGIVEKSTAMSKRFDYGLDGTTLNFTLRIDTKKELEAFKSCMLMALIDIDAELKLLSAKK